MLNKNDVVLVSSGLIAVILVMNLLGPLLGGFGQLLAIQVFRLIGVL